MKLSPLLRAMPTCLVQRSSILNVVISLLFLLDSRFADPWTSGFFVSRWPRHGMDTLTRRILTRHDTEIIDTIDYDTPWHATFRTWQANNNMTRQRYRTKFLNIFVTHVPTSWGHVKKSGTKYLKIFFTHVPTSLRHVKSICPSSAKSICYFSVCHWVFSQGSTHNNRGW